MATEATPRRTTRRSARLANHIEDDNTNDHESVSFSSSHGIPNDSLQPKRKNGKLNEKENTTVEKEEEEEEGEGEKEAQTAASKFEYDVLCNELFHLKEFGNLPAFDPLVDYSEKLNFQSFIKENNLELDSAGRGHSNLRKRKNIQKLVQDRYNKAKKDVKNHETSRLMHAQNKNKAVKNSASSPKPYQHEHSRQYSVKKEHGDEEKENHSNGILEANGNSKQEPAISLKKRKNTTKTTKKLQKQEDQEATGEESTHSYTSSSSDLSEYELISPPKKKLKFVLSPYTPTITNPMHVTIPKYANLNEYLNSFRSLDEDMSQDEFQQYVLAQSQIFQKIRNAVQSNVLKVQDHELKEVNIKDVSLPQQHIEPIKLVYKQQNQYPLQDHLINQGVVLSKLFQRSQRNKAAITRKIANMIEQHFKHIQGAEQRRVKEEKKKIRALARSTAHQVKRRWALAEKAYRVLKKNEENELKKIQGKKHLSEMLEKSSMLLNQQLNINEEETSEDIESESGLEEDESNTSFSGSDEELTTEEEEELEEDEKLENDLLLTVEQLKEKYKDLDAQEKQLDQHAGDTDGIDGVASVLEDADSKTALIAHGEFSESDAGLLDEDSFSESNSDSISTEYSSSDIGQNEEDKEEEEQGFDEGDGDETHSVNHGVQRTSALSSLFEDYGDKDDSEVSDFEVAEKESENISRIEDLQVDEMRAEEVVEDGFSVKSQEITENDKSPDSSIELERYKNEDMQNDHTDAEMLDSEPSAEQSKETTDPLAVVDVPVPKLLKGTLRIYQKQGLNWLASLYNNQTNGILADEMGLGKTIQTISLLCWLAMEKKIWGPHLIVVPTSVLLNWEMEFKRFAPGFKVLSYYGTPQERKRKRKGWNKLDAFHICITSYQLVVTDQHSFKRKKWQYMILDEAHNIKNFRSTRWQALLNFNTERRLLLTGTPLQNNITELWSLLYFLMPKTLLENGAVEGFADLDAFQQWFGNPVDKIMETTGSDAQDSDTQKTVDKLHQVLRPYLLRRLKADVEKQMPGKHEHIVYCKLSKRQRFLYDEFMSRAQTRETLANGNFLSIINCLMQLRKVCNHPDLFEVRPIVTSLAIEKSVADDYLFLARRILQKMAYQSYDKNIDLKFMGMLFTQEIADQNTLKSSFQYDKVSKLSVFQNFSQEIVKLRREHETENSAPYDYQNITKYYETKERNRIKNCISSLEHMNYVNMHRCNTNYQYGKNLIDLVTVNGDMNNFYVEPTTRTCLNLINNEKDNIDKFGVITPNVVVLQNNDIFMNMGVNSENDYHLKQKLYGMDNPFHHLQTKLAIEFPDKSLLQYDCGKLQKLATLLKDLKDNGHRALIFTQMTKVLDILEQFLNNHGYLYLRLDGATKIEDRQMLTEKFNSDTRVTCFILSSRSGGLGINLTGADTVIFYDSDWNPAMDKQCQDRCHRIGQTRDVHIYRFVSEHTIESNILKKAQQKTQLDNVIIQQGDFTTDYFSKLTVKDMLGNENAVEELVSESAEEEKPNTKEEGNTKLLIKDRVLPSSGANLSKLLAQAEDEDDAKAVNVALQESNLDSEDFKEASSIPAMTTANGLPLATTNGIDTTSTQQTEQQLAAYDDEYEGTNHVEEYMIRFIANGFYYD